MENGNEKFQEAKGGAGRGSSCGHVTGAQLWRVSEVRGQSMNHDSTTVERNEERRREETEEISSRNSNRLIAATPRQHSRHVITTSLFVRTIAHFQT
jgi:hypothetical protein